MTIRVGICDDQPLLRDGLRVQLGLVGDFDVVGEAANGEQAVALARRERPDVLVMDVRMPVLDGIEATRRIMGGPGTENGGRPRRELLASLTQRETEVLRLVAAGLSNAELADRLVISHATAKTHVSRILTKLGLRDRAQLVVAAYEAGLAGPGH